MSELFRGIKETRLFGLHGCLRPFTPAGGWLLGLVILQTVQADLDSKRADWALSLDQLAQYTDSLEKELIKMASNMRRSRTEILHLSVRWADLCLGSLCMCGGIWKSVGSGQICELLKWVMFENVVWARRRVKEKYHRKMEENRFAMDLVLAFLKTTSL